MNRCAMMRNRGHGKASLIAYRGVSGQVRANRERSEPQNHYTIRMRNSGWFSLDPVLEFGTNLAQGSITKL